MVISAYSRMASRGRTWTLYRFGNSSRILVPDGGLPKNSATRSRATTSQTKTFLPRRAAASASAAETVLLPVPPFPVTTTRRRLRRADSLMGRRTVVFAPESVNQPRPPRGGLAAAFERDPSGNLV